MSRDMTNAEAIANLNHIYGIVSPDIQRSLDVAFKAMERSEGEWIPVSERLPEERGMYLVTEKEFAIGDRNHSGKSGKYADTGRKSPEFIFVWRFRNGNFRIPFIYATFNSIIFRYASCCDFDGETESGGNRYTGRGSGAG